MKKLLVVAVVAALVGCTDAQMASNNLAKAAEMFELERRIVFYNGVTGDYILSIEGKCFIEHSSIQLAVTCKIGEEEYFKHHLGLSDNVSYFSEQLEAAAVDVYHYRVIFKPEAIIPNVDLETSFN